MKKKLILFSLVTLTIIIAVLLLCWSLVMFSKNPVNNFLAKKIPFPVVCTFKNCISSTEWLTHHNLEKSFAENMDAAVPTTTESLTTLTRQTIANEAFLKSPVTRTGAKRYREEILNLKDEEQLKEVMDLSLQDYDTFIIMPWLKQEALRQEHEVETTTELFKKLSADKLIIVWPIGMSWDQDKAEVVKSD